MSNKFMAIMDCVGCICAIFLSWSNHHLGNGEASIAWAVAACLGLGNFFGHLADAIEKEAA